MAVVPAQSCSTWGWGGVSPPSPKFHQRGFNPGQPWFQGFPPRHPHHPLCVHDLRREVGPIEPWGVHTQDGALGAPAVILGSGPP